MTFMMLQVNFDGITYGEGRIGAAADGCVGWPGKLHGGFEEVF